MLNYMKHTAIVAAVALFALPLVSAAATLEERAQSFIGFINGTLVPLIFAVAFLVFIWGVFNYFILGGSNEEKRNEGKSFVMYGVIGFVVMMTVWGLVNIVKNSLDFGGNEVRPSLPTFSR